MENRVVFNNDAQSKIRFNNMTFKSSTTERMLEDVTPFEWSETVLSGDANVVIQISQEEAETKE
jgi:hypothetical protein